MKYEFIHLMVVYRNITINGVAPRAKSVMRGRIWYNDMFRSTIPGLHIYAWDATRVFQDGTIIISVIRRI
jgi:hypothetical protein